MIHSGMERMVRTLGVTSSPVVPSPRVTRADKRAFFVNQRHAEAVEFVFGDVFDLFAAGEFADAAIEIGELVEREGVVEADHRGFMADLLKTFAGDAANALGGRIGRGEFRDFRLPAFSAGP